MTDYLNVDMPIINVDSYGNYSMDEGESRSYR